MLDAYGESFCLAWLIMVWYNFPQTHKHLTCPL